MLEELIFKLDLKKVARSKEKEKCSKVREQCQQRHKDMSDLDRA